MVDVFMFLYSSLLLRLSGVITAMCMDTVQSCLILGTGCGYHTCIDLRFRLPISTVVHPYCEYAKYLVS